MRRREVLTALGGAAAAAPSGLALAQGTPAPNSAPAGPQPAPAPAAPVAPPGATPAAPAVVGPPELRWRFGSGLPRQLDVPAGAADLFRRFVAEATDGRFRIEVAPSASAPGDEARGEAHPADLLAAVAGGGLDVAYLAAADAAVTALPGPPAEGRSAPAGTPSPSPAASPSAPLAGPAFALATSGPFGLNARQQNAWMLHGGGLELFNEIFAGRGLYALPGGNTGARMGGWFRREVKVLADLKGLRVRIRGLGARVLERLGAAPRDLAPAEIVPALEGGTLDAAEWTGPYDDERLGLGRAARIYHYPGFWEGGAMLHLWFSAERWADLPKPYRAVLRGAAAAVHADVQARYDAANPAALRRLFAGGAQVRPFPAEVLDAAYRAAGEVYAELAPTDADFKRAYEAMRAFRNEEYLWFQVAEYAYDNYMIRARARG